MELEDPLPEVVCDGTNSVHQATLFDCEGIPSYNWIVTGNGTIVSGGAASR